MQLKSQFLGALAVSLTFGACGVAIGGATTAPVADGDLETVRPSEAAPLLDHATFGVTASDVARVQRVGIDVYINEQLAAAPTRYTGYEYVPPTAPANCVYDPVAPAGAASLCARDRYS